MKNVEKAKMENNQNLLRKLTGLLLVLVLLMTSLPDSFVLAVDQQVPSVPASFTVINPSVSLLHEDGNARADPVTNPSATISVMSGNVPISPENNAENHNGWIIKVKETQRLQRFSLPDSIEELGHYKGVYFAGTQDDIEWLKLLGEVVYIEPNYEVTLFDAPKDGIYEEQTNLHMINVEGAWDIGCYGSNVRIGVIDTGVYNHPDLGGNILAGYNYRDNNSNTDDTNGHGTFVSGLIAACRNDVGMAGVAYKAKIVPLKCFGTGMTTSLKSIIDAIYGAVDDFDCQIINMSFGLDSNPYSLAEAVDYAVTQGVIITAAVGNDGNGTLYYPAAYNNVIGVGSVNNDKSLSGFSHRNTSVFVTAPGNGVKSLGTDGGYRIDSGTSFSAPLVTGLAAMLKAADDALSVDEVKLLLASTSEGLGGTGYDIFFGYGLVDAQALIKAMITEFVPGDVNGDGDVDGRDLLYMARYLAEWPGYELSHAQMFAADVDGDGEVDGRDIVYLARHFAEWPGYEVLGKLIKY